jgi:hypothetical protein
MRGVAFVVALTLAEVGDFVRFAVHPAFAVINTHENLPSMNIATDAVRLLGGKGCRRTSEISLQASTSALIFLLQFLGTMIIGMSLGLH